MEIKDKIIEELSMGDLAFADISYPLDELQQIVGDEYTIVKEKVTIDINRWIDMKDLSEHIDNNVKENIQIKCSKGKVIYEGKESLNIFIKTDRTGFKYKSGDGDSTLSSVKWRKEVDAYVIYKI